MLSTEMLMPNTFQVGDVSDHSNRRESYDGEVEYTCNVTTFEGGVQATNNGEKMRALEVTRS
jgi:hypothetical protein